MFECKTRLHKDQYYRDNLVLVVVLGVCFAVKVQPYAGVYDDVMQDNVMEDGTCSPTVYDAFTTISVHTFN